MTSPATDYSQFSGKRVLIVTEIDGEAAEVEATLEVVNDHGVLVKPKGKPKLEIIRNEHITEIREIAAVAAVSRKSIKPIPFGKVRSHLAERHGLKVSDINAMTEEQAQEFHNGLDHAALDLGHDHAVKEAPAVAAEKAANAA